MKTIDFEELDQRLFKKEIDLFNSIEVGKIYVFEMYYYGKVFDSEPLRVISKTTHSAASYCLEVANKAGNVGAKWIKPISLARSGAINLVVTGARKIS